MLPLKYVAFYLPQFHQFEENDEFWGTGFTEWVNVRRAKPLYPGHLQPQVPIDGYYDLKESEVITRQAKLAYEYGIDAFCIYSYWFSGKRVMNRPLDSFLGRELPTKYCICWANEPWTRRWDGLESEILISQEHDAESDAKFIDDHAEFLKDQNYLHVDGKPILIIYRNDILNQPLKTVDNFRRRAQELGIGEIFIVMAQTFGSYDPRPFGYDAAIQFPPHNYPRRLVNIKGIAANFDGEIHDYESLVLSTTTDQKFEFDCIPAVMPGWDNTPRRMENAAIYYGDNKYNFGWWLRSQSRIALRNCRTDSPLVFINAWNEWGEGAQLEPDQVRSYSRLEAVLESKKLFRDQM